MRGTAGQKPQLPMCHLCGQQFGTASLQIHQKACAQKYERERGRPAPERSAGCGEDRVIKPGSTAREVEEFNDAAYAAWSADLEPCPHCSRKFLPDRLAVHVRSCSWQPGVIATDRGSGGGSKGGSKGKALPICHLCGLKFGTASLHIHLKECAKRYERERGRPAPKAPAMPGGDGLDDERPMKPATNRAWEEYNEAAWASAQAQLEACPHCGRTFAHDRLQVHLRSCGPKESRELPSEERTAEGSRAQPKPSPSLSKSRAAPKKASTKASAKAKTLREGDVDPLALGGLCQPVDISEDTDSRLEPAASDVSPLSARAPRGNGSTPSHRSGAASNRSKAKQRRPSAAVAGAELSPAAAPAHSALSRGGSKKSVKGRGTARERMEQLDELREAGLLTQSEYDEKRTSIIMSL